MKVLKMIVFDFALIALVILIGLMFPEYRWFVNFLIITASVLLAFISIGGLADESVKDELFNAFNKKSYYNTKWFRAYDAITDLIMIASLVYFQFVLATIFYCISKMFLIVLKKGYREHKAEEKSFE